MTAINRVEAPRDEEETPLLREQRRDDVDENRSETLASGDGSEEDPLADGSKANPQVGRLRGFFIILSTWSLIFLQAANMSGITTTQSKIAEDLDSFVYVSWFSSAYLIGMASLSPIYARLAQLFSPRNCIAASAVLFSIGAVVTSQAPNLEIFLLGRALSGSGGAGILTISYILVLELADKKKRGLYIGAVNAGFTTGISLGAVIAGICLPVTGWRFLFWIQSPLGLLAGLGIFLSIPKTFTSGDHSASKGSVRDKLARIDYLGAFTLIATLVSFLYGLSASEIFWQPIALSGVLFAIFIATEVYVASEPFVPIVVLKSRGTLFCCLAQLGVMSARWMVLFYTPVFAIAIRGWSPGSAGSILIPTNVGFGLGGLLVGWLHIKRVGSYWLSSVTSYLLLAGCQLVLALTSHESTPPLLYFFIVLLNGLFTGAALNYTLAHLLYQTPSSTHFIVTSLLSTFRGFAGSFSSAISGGFFARLLENGLETGFEKNGGLKGKEELVRRLLGSPALVNTLKGADKLVAVDSYTIAVKGLFLVGTGLIALMVVVQAGTGWKGAVEKEGEAQTVDNGGEEWEEGLEQVV